MKIAVLGTGMVGEAIASKLVTLGHEVKMGSRDAKNDKALAWSKKAGGGASTGTFSEAASFGELAFLCTKGDAAVDVVTSTGDKLSGKVLVDVTNPLDFSQGMPPTLFVCNSSSLGERIQTTFPNVKVVKTLNTITAALMVDPGKLKGGDHTMFMCGNDAAAKGRVKEILAGWFGWKDLVDLGDISQARGTEMFLPLWIRLYGTLKSPDFSIKLVR